LDEGQEYVIKIKVFSIILTNFVELYYERLNRTVESSMKKIKGIIYRFTRLYLSVTVLFFNLQTSAFAQDGSYSMMAQRILADQNALNAEGETAIDVFKFSINDVLNSLGETVENASGEPTIFGRTDYGSEFSLTNDLSTSFNIEIPSFVINNLAENDSGEFFSCNKKWR
jgi:hypothetical protein